LRDENTKFFHTNATIKHSKNCIRTLQDSNGVPRVQHDDKALLLWDSYTERLGQSDFSNMHFHLEGILLPLADLEDLILPFSTEEIDGVVRNLKSDKSSGPDGFNIDFMKKCWEVIKPDFYDLCSSFYDHDVCLQSINGSYVTLVPKIDNPAKVGDSRPISLLNKSVKLLT
jgi:hypothetical protein